MPRTIGVISDTHGLLRPEVLQIFSGVDLIIHSGDIGNPDILEELKKIAKVEAIKGNVDKDIWSDELPDTHMFEFENKRFYLIHNLDQLDLDPKAAGIDFVVSGHSHEPKLFEKENVVYLNPGSAGTRRFKLPVTVALIRLNDKIEYEIITIDN